jgi:hypothetical protein
MGETPKPETASLSLEAALYDTGSGRFSVRPSQSIHSKPATEVKQVSKNKQDQDES